MICNIFSSNKNSVLILFIFMMCASSLAQNGAPSTYTSFGIGRIERTGNARIQAMGGVGIALVSEYSVNTLNPASLAGVNAEQMLINLGVKGNYATFSHNSESGTGISAGLNNITLAFKSSKKIRTAVNINQFSSVGYNILSNDYIQGTNTLIDKSYRGSGGINQISLINSIGLSENLSLGTKLSYLFGKLRKTEFYSSSEIGGDLSVEYADFLQQIYLEAGFQYKIPIRESTLMLGGIFSKRTKFGSNREVTTSSSSGAGIIDEIESNTYEIPSYFGTGLSWSNHKGILIAFDYRYDNWKEIQYTNPLTELKNSHFINGGLEFKRRKSRRANPFTWRIGGFYEDSYIKVMGNAIQDKGITMGVGVPLRTKNSYLNLSFKYGNRGNQNKSLITEIIMSLV